MLIFGAYQTDKIVYDLTLWNQNVKLLTNPLEIGFDLTTLLDPKLLISSFEDLQRYYQSIEIYISWDYETQVKSSLIGTSENFPQKQGEYVFRKNLNELQYYNDKLIFVTKPDNYEINIVKNKHCYYIGECGTGTVGLTIENSNKIYKIGLTATMTAEITDECTGKHAIKTNTSNMYLGFQALDNNRLNFNVQFFPIVLYATNTIATPQIGIANNEIRWISKYSLTISKIILNPK